MGAGLRIVIYGAILMLGVVLTIIIFQAPCDLGLSTIVLPEGQESMQWAASLMKALERPLCSSQNAWFTITSIIGLAALWAGTTGIFKAIGDLGDEN